MKFQMNQNSLFAVLLRSQWWISIAVALVIFVIAQHFLPWGYAIFVGLPFFCIGAYVGWKQLQAPSAGRVAGTVEAIREMSWSELAGAVEAAYVRDGYTVKPFGGNAADFELWKEGRTSLVACKRWKAARTGIEPLRELVAAKESREARECIYILAGDITDNARKFAAQKRVRLVADAELVKLLPEIGRKR
jgi:restriction system protein